MQYTAFHWLRLTTTQMICHFRPLTVWAPISQNINTCRPLPSWLSETKHRPCRGASSAWTATRRHSRTHGHVSIGWASASHSSPDNHTCNVCTQNLGNTKLFQLRGRVHDVLSMVCYVSKGISRLNCDVHSLITHLSLSPKYSWKWKS